jgi:hypothetical protein
MPYVYFLFQPFRESVEQIIMPNMYLAVTNTRLFHVVLHSL